MKFQKSVIAFAVATAMMGATVSAQAGDASKTYNTFAIEALKSAPSAVVSTPNIAYAPGQLIAANTTFTIYIRLNNGAKFAADAATYSTATFGDIVAAGTPALSSDGTVLALTFTSTANQPTTASLTMPVVANGLDLGTSTLKDAPGTVSADFAFVNGGVSGAVAFPSSPTDTATGIVAGSAYALNVAVKSSSTFSPAESKQINVEATPPFSQVSDTATPTLTGAGLVDFGSVTLTEVPGVKKIDGSTDFAASDLGSMKFSLAGNFLTGETATPTPNVVFTLNSKNTCDSATTVPSTVTLTATSVSFTVNAPVTDPYYVCMAVDTANKSAIPETQPTINPVNLLVDTTVVNATGSGTLYNLVRNGASAQLINYVPAAAAPYQTYVRVANNSSLTAPVTVAVIGADGTTLGSGTLNASMAPGASMTYSAAQVETAAGVTLPAADRVQVLLTAPVPSGKLNAQAFLADANGGFTNMTNNK